MSRSVKKSAATPPTPQPKASSSSSRKTPRASRSLPRPEDNDFDSNSDAPSVLIGLLEASYLLAILADGEGTPTYPPASLYLNAPAAELNDDFLRLLNIALANLRIARVRLSSATAQDSLASGLF
jgi:hypothetical protein